MTWLRCRGTTFLVFRNAVISGSGISNLKDLEKIKVENEEYYYHLTDVMSERWQEISTKYPHNFRASFLVQFYSGIESELRKICDHYHRQKKTAKTAEEMKARSDFA